MGEVREFEDLLSLELPPVECTEENLIEGELDVYTSLVYNIKTKEYFIQSFDMNDFDDIELPIEDVHNFGDFTINGYTITQKDIDNFVKLVKQNLGD